MTGAARGGEVYRGRGRGRPYVGRVVHLASTVSRRRIPRVDIVENMGNEDGSTADPVSLFPPTEAPVCGMRLPEYRKGPAGRAIKFACDYMPIKWKDAPRGVLARLRAFFKL